jgi:hypothetical protein
MKMKQNGYLVEKKFSLNPSPAIAEDIIAAREEAKRLTKLFGVAYILTDKKGLHFRVSAAPGKTKLTNRIYEVWKPNMVPA